jgi:hypothetical protein
MTITLDVPTGATQLNLTPSWVTARPPSLPALGMSHAGYAPAIAAGLGPIPVARLYNDPAAGVPAVYPGPGLTRPAGAHLALSIKPNMADVIAGKLDGQLAAYFKQAAPGDDVTGWHEGERHNEGTPAATVLAFHARMARVFAASAPAGARYGQCFTAFSATNGRVNQWTAPRLGFYAIDGYQSDAAQTPQSIFGAWLDELPSAAAMGPLAVWECNSTLADVNRAAWLTASYGWAKHVQADTFAIFYGNSIPWTPATAGPATLSAIRAIGAESRS